MLVHDGRGQGTKFDRFSLVLTVTHNCNLRCTYCYAGEKQDRLMSLATGQSGIDRAVRSLNAGGTLELGFFGGEPLLEAERVSALISYARERIQSAGCHLRIGLTTNGTQTSTVAWSVMTMPDVHIVVSHDGLARIHDRHRRTAGGSPTSRQVLSSIKALIRAGKEVRVVMVVRPDTVAFLADGIEHLRTAGVRFVEPSLDLWTEWTSEDALELEAAITRAAAVWRQGLPDFGVGWFDDKAARMAGVPITDCARCGFGNGEIAVAPSGNLYPCERLIGDDRDDNVNRLPGHVTQGPDFLGLEPPPPRENGLCEGCVIDGICNTYCRCSNFVRTGDVTRPDRLLCMLNQFCVRETGRQLALLGPMVLDARKEETCMPRTS